MALKTSKVAELLDGLASLMLKEINEAKAENGIPLSASDKAVALALIRHCGVSAEPDSDTLSNLKDAFKDDLKERREQRAKLLSQQMGTEEDGLGELMH